MTSTAPWFLHEQLARDTVAIGELPLSRALLMDDANYPWLVLVPRRPAAIEILDLGEAEQTRLMGEIALLARALKETTGCDKLNIAAIGNVVPQLHIHIVARNRNDAAWPRPVWGAVPPRAYEPVAQRRLIQAMQRQLAGALQ
jgi:diadenosine tetraphosphate (Ap4A) HIT family hydrolase